MRELNIAISLAGLFLFATNAVRGQASAKLEFEVASVKPMPPSPTSSRKPRAVVPGRRTLDRSPGQACLCTRLLKTAYDVESLPSQRSRLARFSPTDYMIVAKAPEGATKEQVDLMWQSLLKDRFGVVVHHESRVFQADEMTLAKGASKLKETDLPDSTPQTIPWMGLKTGPDGLPRLPAAGLTVIGGRSDPPHTWEGTIAGASGEFSGDRWLAIR